MTFERIGEIKNGMADRAFLVSRVDGPSSHHTHKNYIKTHSDLKWLKMEATNIYRTGEINQIVYVLYFLHFKKNINFGVIELSMYFYVIYINCGYRKQKWIDENKKCSVYGNL